MTEKPEEMNLPITLDLDKLPDLDAAQKQERVAVIGKDVIAAAVDLLPLEPLRRTNEDVHIQREARSEQLAIAESKIPVEDRDLRNSQGKYIKRVHLVLILPRRRVTKMFRAGPGRRFTPKGVEALLAKFSQNLEEAFPGVVFRLVEVKPNEQFNVIHPAAEKGPEIKGRSHEPVGDSGSGGESGSAGTPDEDGLPHQQDGKSSGNEPDNNL